jgi:hypothetical protein
MKIIIGVQIGQKKNVVQKFLRIHCLEEIPICIQIKANGPAGLPKWCFNTLKIPYWGTTFWASHHQIPF